MEVNKAVIGDYVPLAIDLFCGLGGWTEGLLAEGWNVIGFDIERHVYGAHRYPAQLVLQDVLTLHGSQFRNADLIVASPPCQAYSYRAMPWSRAKALPPPDNTLFDACFRIQREACEAAGRHIPLIVENVRGAQKWVGRSRWNYGSFHLWGNVPALMPMTKAMPMKVGVTHRPDGATNFHQGKYDGNKNPGFRFDGSGRSMQSESVDRHIKNTSGSWFNVAHNTTSGKGRNPDGRKLVRDVPRVHAAAVADLQSAPRFADGSADTTAEPELHHVEMRGLQGTKQPGISGRRANGKGDAWFQDGAAAHGSKSSARKAASALIAKIPFPLAQYIAKVFKPTRMTNGS